MLTNKTITQFTDQNPAHSPAQVENSIQFTNAPRTHKIFERLPNKTSSGLDSIPPIVLKHLPFKIITDYTILFNNCLNNHFFPDLWKKAKIFPILKKNKLETDPSSYRPISLTPAISKVFEAIINETLENIHGKTTSSLPTSLDSPTSYLPLMQSTRS